jgi:hypothetical protein
MTVRISELNELSVDLSQSDVLPIVDISAGETKQIQTSSLLQIGISGAPSSFIDLSKLDQNSVTKLGAIALESTGVASGVYGAADTVGQFTVNDQGLVTTATGVTIVISADNVTGLAPVATSGDYQSLTGLPTLGTLSPQDADNVTISGGTISGVTFISGNVTISGGTIGGITDLAIDDGGTGASTASGARTNLGLAIGIDVQGHSSVLDGTITAFDTANSLAYASASGVVDSAPITAFGRTLLAQSGATEVRTELGLGSIALQNADNVTISGGTISGITLVTGDATISGGTITGIVDLAVADGGTGASTAEDARSNLGLAIGSNVQAYSNVLSDIAAQFDEPDEIVYASASGVVAGTPFTAFARSIVSGSTASGVRDTLELGSIALQDADSVVIVGGTISGATFISGDVTISGGTISGITDLAIDDGGTGASTASGARTNLGLAIGSDVQAYSAVLSGVANSFTASDEIAYASASGVVSSTPFTSFARSIISGSTDSDVRDILGLGSIALQNASSVAINGGTISDVSFSSSGVTITGGTISGIADLAIDDGGTGASDATSARTNLGLAIGSDVQAYNVAIDGTIAAFSTADSLAYSSASGVVEGTAITSFGRTFVAQSGATEARAELGLDSMALQSASSVAISGGTIENVTFASSNVTISGGTIGGITDLAIDDGGTGASDASSARTNLGVAIGTDVQAYSSVLDGAITAFDTADAIAYSSASGVVASSSITSFGRTLIAQSGATEARTELGLGSIALQNAGSVAISGGTISGITDLAIADGGTGASSAADARTNLGLAIGSDIQAYDAGLASIAGLTTAADELIYLTGADTYAVSPLPSYSRDFLASGNSAADARNVLGLGDLSTKTLVGPGDVDAAAISGANIVSASLTFANYGDGSVLEATIGDGAVTTSKIADSGVTAIKLADDSSTIVDSGPPASNGTFVGQHYFDELSKYDYIWDGVDWQRQAALEEIDFTGSAPIAFTVTYPDLYSASIATELTEQNAATVLAGPTTGSAAVPTFRTLQATDLPIATSGTVGAVSPGAGLGVDGLGSMSHVNTAIAGTYAGAVTIDAQGHIVTAQAALSADDIPDLDASKIVAGTFTSDFLAPNSVTASQLADYGIAVVSESAPSPEFAGQWWINPNDRAAYIWVGEVEPVANGYWLNLGYGSPTQINLRFGGTYNASGNTVQSINSYGIEAGLTVGQALSAPSTSNNGVYLIVTASGTGTAPAPSVPLSVGNWVLSEGVGSVWTRVDLGSAVAGVADQDVLVDGTALIPTASGVASQEDLNLLLWARAQIATTGSTGIVRASSEIVVASGTGIMSIGTVDDEFY